MIAQAVVIGTSGRYRWVNRRFHNLRFPRRTPAWDWHDTVGTMLTQFLDHMSGSPCKQGSDCYLTWREKIEISNGNVKVLEVHYGVVFSVTIHALETKRHTYAYHRLLTTRVVVRVLQYAPAVALMTGRLLLLTT